MMKKAIAAVIAALMMLPFTGQAYAADEAALSFGDPNDDGKIDAKDASFVLEAYAKLSTGSEDVLTSAESTAADVRTDGNVDAKDASAILAYYAYLSTGGSYTLPVFLGYEEPEEYEYKLENITKSAAVFNYFANQLNYEILQGADTQLIHINGEEYWTNGKNQAKVMLLLLNENEIYSPGVLSAVFENYNTQNYEDGILYAMTVPAIQERRDYLYINYDMYSIDNENVNYLNHIQSIWQNAVKKEDITKLDEELGKFFYDDELSYRDVLFYYSLGISGTCPNSDYNFDAALTESRKEDIYNTRDQLIEKVYKD